MCLGVPGRITAVEDGLVRMGTVDFDGSTLEVCLAYVPEAGPGDYVLVHAGFSPAWKHPLRELKKEDPWDPGPAGRWRIRAGRRGSSPPASSPA